MTVPTDNPSDLAGYIQVLEDRIAALETVASPRPLYPITSATLTAAMAVAFTYTFVFVTDLNMTAHSNGAHWYRSDTGALII